ncbi:MAG: sel1 repeat family protein [Ignavibacteriales bacterium]|nr:sel1 repeat family protein [Ignavibacteriales bacterium]
MLLSLFSTGFVSAGETQTHPNSPVFRDYIPPRTSPLVKPINAVDRDWYNFTLTQNANSGDVIAQHELGLRYFLGEGFPVDTLKAAYWIKKAALHRFVPAMFNLGVFELHGWGVEWDPFDAYQNFLYAAEEMPDAQYVLAIFLMDNLVVPRNETEAYCLVKTAADSGYEPAFELLMELEKRWTGSGSNSTRDAAIQNSDSSSHHSSSSHGLIFLDFNRDTTSSTNDTILVEEAMRDGGEALN